MTDHINIGSLPNDGTGDKLRSAVDKERVRQGGWDVGETDTPLQSYLQLFQHTMGSKS